MYDSKEQQDIVRIDVAFAVHRLHHHAFRLHLPYSSRPLNLPIAPLVYLKHIYAIQEKRAICTSSQAEQRLKVVMFIPNLDGKCD